MYQIWFVIANSSQWYGSFIFWKSFFAFYQVKLVNTFRIFRVVSLFSFQCSVWISLNSLSYSFKHVNYFFKFFWNPLKLYGEGGIWTHAPLLTTYSLSRGAPSTSWVLLQVNQADWLQLITHSCYNRSQSYIATEKVGFEPTAPFGVTGFQDQLLKPLGHLSMCCLNSISF